jgi:hypothetical protein
MHDAATELVLREVSNLLDRCEDLMATLLAIKKPNSFDNRMIYPRAKETYSP